ncbi:hypothetical protein ACFLUS_05780 [Chloroflexota bacterium]
MYSFDCDYESIDLAEGIQIKPAPKDLREYIKKKSHYLYGRWDDPSKFDWAAFLPHRAKAIKVIRTEENIVAEAKIGYEEHDRARDLLVDLATALRLCHQGMVTPGPLISADQGTTIWTPVSKSDFLHKKTSVYIPPI